MSLGKWVRRIILAVAATVAVIWTVGSFASRRHRTIRMTALVPADAELGAGTPITAARERVGTVAELGEPVWGIPLEVGTTARHRAWISLVLAAGESARSDARGSLLRLQLDASDSVLTLASGGADALVLRRDQEGKWAGEVGAGTRLLVNGDPAASGERIEVAEGDLLTLAGTEVRLGRFGRFRPAELHFTTRKLCPAQAEGFFPGSEEEARCRALKLGGTAELELRGLFGLTKPVLQLTPSEGEPSTLEQPVRGRLHLAVQRDVVAEVQQILGYLNSPVAERPTPRTHFEHTLARVDRVLQRVDTTAGRINATVKTLQVAMRPGGPGLGSLVLRPASYRALDSTLARVARITEPLADSTRTLAENAGLGPLLARVDSTLDSADVVLKDVQGQINRLAPRIELAVEGTARTIEGAEGTMVALKAAAEDIQSIKRGAQASKGYAIGGGVTLLLTQLLTAIAAIVYLVP
jgi:hypothetical protein